MPLKVVIIMYRAALPWVKAVIPIKYLYPQTHGFYVEPMKKKPL